MTDTPMTDPSVSEEIIPRDDGKSEIVLRRGQHVGWALQKDESTARRKALARLRYCEDMCREGSCLMEGGCQS